MCCNISRNDLSCRVKCFSLSDMQSNYLQLQEHKEHFSLSRSPLSNTSVSILSLLIISVTNEIAV